MAGRGAKKRFLALIAVIVSAFALSGCGASITVYSYYSDGVRYTMFVLSVDNDVAESMEKTAATDANDQKYTVESYFYELFSLLGCELVEARKTSEAYTASYRKADTGGALLPDPVFSTTYDQNPFVRTYVSVADNPFNGLRESYDNAEPGMSSTVPEILKNGYVVHNEYGESSVIFPSVVSAFPYVAGRGEEGLLLNYVWIGPDRMQSSGKAADLGDRKAQYVFSRYFDYAQTQIMFRYKRAVPYGWYMVAVAAGLTTLVIISLVTRTKKQKPTLLDRFPYDPEEFRDYESRLPLIKR